jgi:protoporphyrinogen oxidase
MSPDSLQEGRFDTLVVGAGMTGLCAAHHLARQGRRVALLDAADRPGGVIGSVRREGCLFERGPNSAMDTTPLIGQLVDTLGLRDQLRWASEASNKRYVRRDGRLLPLPMSPGAFFSTPLFSLGAKLALMGEPFRPAGDPKVEEPIAAFVRRRLGHEFLDYAIDPFVAGIYAGDPEQISVQAAFPKLHALEQRWGSLIKGQFLGARERKRRGEVANNAARSFSFAGGMQVLTDALAADVSQRGGLVLLGTRAATLSRESGAGRGLRADRAARRRRLHDHAARAHRAAGHGRAGHGRTAAPAGAGCRCRAGRDRLCAGRHRGHGLHRQLRWATRSTASGR